MRRTCRGDDAHLAPRIVTTGLTPQTKGSLCAWQWVRRNARGYASESVPKNIMRLYAFAITPHAILYDVLPSLGFLRCCDAELGPGLCEATTLRIHRLSETLRLRHGRSLLINSMPTSRSDRNMFQSGPLWWITIHQQHNVEQDIALIILEPGSTIKGCAEKINNRATIILCVSVVELARSSWVVLPARPWCQWASV